MLQMTQRHVAFFVPAPPLQADFFSTENLRNLVRCVERNWETLAKNKATTVARMGFAADFLQGLHDKFATDQKRIAPINEEFTAEVR